MHAIKKYTEIFLLIIAAFLFSCQHELFFDTLPSAGYLQDSSGNCFPKTIHGNYTAGANAGDSNFIDVPVRVTRAGSYRIFTDTANSLFFEAAGNFPDTGFYILKLTAMGRPDSAGANIFKVRYDNNQCLIVITVSIGPGGPVSDATYTLLGAPDTCLPALIAGTYITDFSLSQDNSVTVKLDVTVAGNYSVSTNEVNGYKFFGNGYIDTGLHQIILKGIGAPLHAGNDVFTLTAASSVCTFTVAVLKPLIISGTNYFPLTTNSYWTYDDVMNTGDTIKRVITDSVAINGFLYHIMHEYDRYGADSALIFRQSGNDYFQYGPVDILTLALKYIPSVFGNINFLKQNLVTGDTWASDEYVGNLFSGQPVYLQYNFLCADANTAITVNGNSFINIYHIVMLPQVRSSTILPYTSTSEVIDLYYAKGVGLVYIKATDNAGYPKKELKLRYWKVY